MLRGLKLLLLVLVQTTSDSKHRQVAKRDPRFFLKLRLAALSLTFLACPIMCAVHV